MLTQNRLYPHLTYHVITDVAQIIDNHLRDDWIIRIEYTEEVEYLNTRWKQWGEPFFKVKGAAVIIDDIFTCHRKKQFCSIRLLAEKYNPRSSFYYSVCRTCCAPRNIRDTQIVPVRK